MTPQQFKEENDMPISSEAEIYAFAESFLRQSLKSVPDKDLAEYAHDQGYNSFSHSICAGGIKWFKDQILNRL